jgi:peroxiredoxin
MDAKEGQVVRWATQSHARCRTKYELPFALLSDQQKEVIKMYGVNGPLGFGVRRASPL